MGILLYNLSNDFYNSFATVIDTEKTCVSTLCNSILKVKKKSEFFVSILLTNALVNSLCLLTLQLRPRISKCLLV